VEMALLSPAVNEELRHDSHQSGLLDSGLAQCKQGVNSEKTLQTETGPSTKSFEPRL
jgi:hypothetical protein